MTHLVRYTWREDKNRLNQKKHGLSFEEACLIFDDPFQYSELERVVDGEERWQTFGMVRSVVLAMVAHTSNEEFEHGKWFEVIHLISARYATAKERILYDKQND